VRAGDLGQLGRVQVARRGVDQVAASRTPRATDLGPGDRRAGGLSLASGTTSSTSRTGSLRATPVESPAVVR
jgi:hypothetical protein